ncbi:MAG: ribokinase, partial [Melioribacteraceae bacterium]|nr:ribokinase [Melioribacteraceae bacterium]
MIISGVENVIITMGAKGCYLKTKQMSSMIPTFKVDAVDTTAAGDVFNGAIAAALAEGMELPDAAVFASAAAVISVTKIGAQSSIPNQNEMNNFIKNR